MSERVTSPPARAAKPRAWGWVLADGVLGVLAGVVALVWPSVTVLALAVLLGVGLLMQGIAEVRAALGAARDAAGRGWTLLFGIVAIVAGLICLLRPGAGLYAIVVTTAVWLLFAGVHELFAGFYLAEHRAWNLTLGVLTIVAAVVMIALPGLALATVALLAGAFFAARGVGEIALALRLRRAGAAHR